MKRRFAVALLFAFSSVIFFLGLRIDSLHFGDEIKYAAVSRTMLLNGNWITPYLNGKPDFLKPPMKFWLTAGLFSIFGATDFVTRLPSAIAACGCLAMTIVLGTRLYGFCPALLAGAIQATTIQLVYERGSTTGEMEMFIILFLISSLYFLLRSEKQPGYLWLSAILMGFSSLTKNFAGLIPFLIAVLYFSISGKWRNFRKSQLVGCCLVIGLISFAWLGIMTYVHGEKFLKIFVLKQSYHRFVRTDYTAGIKSAQTLDGAFQFLAGTILRGFFPWSLILIPAVIWNISKIRTRAAPELILYLWILVYVVGLLLLKNKFYWYVHPLYPAFALLIGKYLTEILAGSTFRSRCVIPVAFGLAGVCFFVFNTHYNPFTQNSIRSGVATILTNPDLIRATLAWVGALILFVLLAKRSFPVAKHLFYCVIIVYSAVFTIQPLLYGQYRLDIHRINQLVAEVSGGHRSALLIWNAPPEMFSEFQIENHSEYWYLNTIPGIEPHFLNEGTDLINRSLALRKDWILLLPAKNRKDILVPHRLVAAVPYNRTPMVFLIPA